MKKFLVCLGILSLASVAFSQSREVYNGEGPVTVPAGNGPIWSGANRAQVLYDNGPLVNSPGTGAGGADESVLQSSSLGMGTLGFGHQVLNDNRVADDFVVPNGETWTVETITFFAYQTGSTTTSTMNGVDVNVWLGDPDSGSFVANSTTLDSTSFTNIYRVTETTLGANNRPIMANVVSFNPPLNLTAGTYWLDWAADGSLGSGPWAPPITINGQTTTGNALQSIAGGAFAPLVDIGNPGLPFIIEGPACTINSIAIAGVDYQDDTVLIALTGECAEGVDIRADATGAIVATNVVVSGSTAVEVDLVLDSTYTAILPNGDTITTAANTVPTLGTWGLIAFLTLLTAGGVYFMRRRRLA